MNSVKEGSERAERCLDALDRDGVEARQCQRETEAHRRLIVTLDRILPLSGVGLRRGCSMMGSEGPIVEADSTWFPNRISFGPQRAVADLTVPAVWAAVARQAVYAPTLSPTPLLRP